MKLNIGCGGRTLPGHINIDMNDEPGVDLVHDIRKPLPFDDNSVESMFASHIIEHLWWMEEVPNFLSTCFDKLENGGYIDIWTVDFDVVVNKYLEVRHLSENTITDNFFKKRMQWVVWRLFSRGGYVGSDHHSIFSRDSLKLLLREAGFKQIDDLQLSDFPFAAHEDMNMGVRAYKWVKEK